MDNYDFKEIQSYEDFEIIADLLKKVFKTSKFSEEYLRWLYLNNPNGNVVGFNAFFNDQLVAHYALVPIEGKLHEKKLNCLLSLNTATAENHQKKNLFKILANKSFDLAKSKNYDIVVAVANANSIHGFINNLGFTHIGKLDAQISFFFPSLRNIKRKDILTFPLSKEIMKWRLNNPLGKYHRIVISNSRFIFHDFHKLFRVIIHAEKSKKFSKKFNLKMPKLNIFIGISQKYHWGIKKYFKFNLPNFMRPSPLHLVVKDLKNGKSINKNNINFECINFDAY